MFDALPSRRARPFGQVQGASLDRPAIWSLGTSSAPRCGLPVVPAASQGWGRVTRRGLDAPLVWAWTAPGQHATADAYAGRLIADVETLVTAESAPRWTGAPEELASAAYLAARSVGVTSHGFVAKPIRRVLEIFASAGCVGVPQVYDSDRSTLGKPGGPVGFLRQCLHSYKKAGFRRVVPLLALSSGVDIVTTWIHECNRLAIPWHLYSLQRLDDAKCRILEAVLQPGQVIDVGPLFPPDPGPSAPELPTPAAPLPPPPPAAPSSAPGIELLLLGALAWWAWGDR